MAIAAGAALVLAGALAVQPAAANDLGPQGGPTAECKAAGYDSGVKLDTGDAGDYVYNTFGDWEPDGLSITLKVWIKADNTFTWEANPAVAAVLVKAGLGYTILPGGTSGSGTPSNGKDISHITFCYNEPDNEPEEHLTVTKTVETSWHRQHHWDLAKSADMDDVDLYVPGQGEPTSATVNWTVTVGYVEPPTDSDFMVRGTITVLNDGDTTVMVDHVTDVITVDVTETPVVVDCGVDLSTSDASLVPGASLECTYEYEAPSMIDGANTATATTTGGPAYASLAMPITWSDTPTTETDATVTVTDVSTLFGEQTKTFYASTGGGTLTYDKTFTWDWYDKHSDPECGDFTYPNVATLTSDDSDLELTASETVNVHVQCLVFQGETAWAANTLAGTLPYNKKGGGNWATYVQYPSSYPVAKTYNVYAGQTHFAGTATVTPIAGGKVQVTVDLDGAWEFADAGSNMKIQTYSSAPSGNPSPGQFAYKTTCTTDPCTSGPIPIAKFYGIHLDVGVWVPDPMFP